jgi:hypothetical protein
MKSNKDLTISEFLCAQNIKRAMLRTDDINLVEHYLKQALVELYK